MNNLATKSPDIHSTATLYDIYTRRPLDASDYENFSDGLSETPSLAEQTQNEYIQKFIDFLKSDEESLDINSNSQLMLFKQISLFNAQISIPEFAIEDDGSLSMIWYGKKGSFILAFNGNLNQKEYSMLCKNGDCSYGTLSDLKDILFYLAKIK